MSNLKLLHILLNMLIGAYTIIIGAIAMIKAFSPEHEWAALVYVFFSAYLTVQAMGYAQIRGVSGEG